MSRTRSGLFNPHARQTLVVAALWTLTAMTVGTLLFIVGYVLWNGLGHVTWQFVTDSPAKMGREGGIGPIIAGTVIITLLAVLIAAPVGVGAAIYLTEYTRENWLTRVIRFGADCLAGVPSIVFGLFGFVFFAIYLGWGLSILSGALTLAIMALPTIIRTSEEAIRAVPASHREVSFGLGSTRWQMVWHVVLRSALPGIVTGVVLSMGRCVSETAAVMLTAGYALRLPTSPFDSSRTMALHFFVLARENISMEKAYATAALLIVTILAINLTAYWMMKKFVTKAV